MRGATAMGREGNDDFGGNHHQPIRVQMFSYGDYEPRFSTLRGGIARTSRGLGRPGAARKVDITS